MVGNADFVQVHSEVAPGPRASQLVYVIIPRISTRAQDKDLAQVQTGEVKRGRKVADAEGFPVEKTDDAPRTAQDAATNHFGVEIQGCAFSQPPPDEERGRERELGRFAVDQAILPNVEWGSLCHCLIRVC